MGALPSLLLHFHILILAMEVKKKKFKKLSWLFFSSLYYVIDLLYCVVLQVKPLLSQTYKNAMQKKYLTKCSKILTDFTLKHIQTKLNNRT